MIKYIYTSEIDLSLDDGPGINEREFVSALLGSHPKEAIAIVPRPAQKDKINKPGLYYFYPHNSKIYRYPLALVSQFLLLRSFLKKKSQITIIMRLGFLPVMATLVKRYPQTKLHLKTLAGYFIFERSEIKSLGQKLRALTLRPFFQAALNSSDQCDTVSHAYVKWFYYNFKIGKNKLKLIPNGVNTSRIFPEDSLNKKQLPSHKFKFTLGYVGALAPLRNIDTLILTLKHLDNDCGLLIVGQGKDGEKLKKLVVEEGLSDRVIFTGAVDYSEVPALISSMDLPVDLSKVSMTIGAKKIDASFSQKIPQYLSMDKPVLAWKTMDTMFLEKENLGVLIDSDHPSVIADSVKDFRLNTSNTKNPEKARQYAIDRLSMNALLKERLN